MTKTKWALSAAALIALTVIVSGVAGTESDPLVIGTGAAKLESGDIICTVTGSATPCINRDLPASLRKSLAAMLTRGFDAPPKAPCPAPICPQPICYQSNPDEWLTMPGAAVPRPKTSP